MVIQPRGVGGEKDLFNLLQALVNRTTYGNYRVGTTTTRVRADAHSFWIKDQAYTVAAADPVADFDNSFTNLGAGECCRVRLEIDTAGAITGKQGAIASAIALAPIPRRSANKTTVAIIEIAVAAGFTFGTTAYNAAGVTFRQGDPDLGDGTGLPPHDRGISAEVLTGA
jgi:hypothetical protein